MYITCMNTNFVLTRHKLELTKVKQFDIAKLKEHLIILRHIIHHIIHLCQNCGKAYEKF